MRHLKKGKKLNRDTSHRKSLYRNLTISLIKSGKIETTLAKAKAFRPFAERLVTLAKKAGSESSDTFLHYFRLLTSRLADKEAARKLISEYAPRFKNRNGGYLRIVKLGPRSSDGAEMARVEWVEETEEQKD